jgi:hypothetical protein
VLTGGESGFLALLGMTKPFGRNGKAFGRDDKGFVGITKVFGRNYYG